MHRHARGLLPLDKAKPDEPLFTTNTGKAFSPSYLSQYVSNQIQSDRLEGYNTKISPHVFRHAFAIISNLSGTDIYDIMRSLGHERLETTEIYLAKTFEKENHAIHSWKPELFG